MGCVRLTERFLKSDPPQDSQIHELRSFVKSELERQPDIVTALKGRRWIGVAGTATYLAASTLGLASFVPEKVNGTNLSLAKVHELVAHFRRLTAAERLGIGGMDRGRADVIVAGGIILEEVLVAAEVENIEVSVRGLRYGVVLVPVRSGLCRSRSPLEG
jgi:exopolyphosphatase/guanosine-5'-triphosphate,3'-diphosphate pyrophosphatase